MTTKPLLLLIALTGAGACAGAPRAGTATPGRCRFSRMQCLVFWDQGGREFMGGATMECPEAEAYVARGNKPPATERYWTRQVLVNAEIDTAADCRKPGPLVEGADFVPKTRGLP